MNRLFAFVRDERVLLAGLGIVTVGFVGMMRMILEFYQDEAIIQPQQPKTQYITQDTEDALKQETLHSLLDHYNFAIKDTALRIVSGRAVNDASTINYLLWSITRADYEERGSSLRALAFILEDKDDGSRDPWFCLDANKVTGALVKSLEMSLIDRSRERLDDVLHDEYYLRDINERRCLVLLSQMIQRFPVKNLLKHDFIGRWLVKQAWGNTTEERQKIFVEYLDRRKNGIRDICEYLRNDRDGSKVLKKHRLLPKSHKRRGHRSGDRIKVVLEISMAEGDQTETEGYRVETTGPVPRMVEQSAEEQRLRRRHREAMVLNDGTQPLGRGDIIEREHDSNS